MKHPYQQNSGIDLALDWRLNRNGAPLAQQLCQHIKQAIQMGALKSGDRIPASRDLVKVLKVSRGTITNAIDQLVAEGLLDTHIGAGTYVSRDVITLHEKSAVQQESEIPRPFLTLQPIVDKPVDGFIDFRPCRPSLEVFPMSQWRRCVMTATLATRQSDYADPKGEPILRRTIVDYLRRARGLNISCDEIIITNGVIHALHLLSTLYLNSKSRVIVENPGYPLAHQVFGLSGAKIIPCPVDIDGLQSEHLPNTTNNIRFVYITPSHQFPTGQRLSLGRRKVLLDWAEKHNVFLIEDDYDGEFRYDVLPLPPLAAMSNNRVIYCGTFSKTMFPGLRLGFAVGPKNVIDNMAALRTMVEYGGNSLLQRALAEFIINGHYERHVYRMRRVYAKKRTVLEKSLHDVSSSLALSGLQSGLNAVVKVGKSVTRLSKRAHGRSVLVPTIAQYAVDKSIKNDSLIIGYAASSIEQIENGVELVFQQ